MSCSVYSGHANLAKYTIVYNNVRRTYFYGYNVIMYQKIKIYA